MRQLALEFAMNVQPFRSADSFRYLVEELNLAGGEPGGATQCSNLTYTGPETVWQPFFPVSPSKRAVFVDAAKGSDSNDGRRDTPVRTVAHALSVLGKQPGSVVLRGGVHYLTETITLDESRNDLTIQNYDGEDAVLSGAKAFSGEWQEHSDNVYTLDLSGVAFHDNDFTGLRRNGVRAFRARYPNGCKADKTASGYACVGKTGNPLDGFGSSLTSKWVFPDSPQLNSTTEYSPDTPSRPEGKSFQTYQLGVGGEFCSGYSPPAGYWCGNKCHGGAPQPPDCMSRWPKGLIYDNSVLPNGPYADASRAVVQAWHPGHWESWMFGISSFNTTHLMFANSGFQGARGAYPGTMADTFFVENVIEELDFENEFFFDNKTHTLYYYTEKGKPAASEVWEATQLKELIHIEGSDPSKPVSNIRILGVTLQNAAYTYLDAHAMPSGGDWALGRMAALFVRNADHVMVDSCSFKQLDGNAVLLNARVSHTTIQNSHFDEIGDNTIGLLGETSGAPDPAWGMGPDGTANTQPRDILIARNWATRCGLFEKQSSFYFQAKTYGNVLKENIFFHGPRAGINFNDGFGGGSVIERNLLFNTVMESGDHGPFNSWDRQPFLASVDGQATTQKMPDEIRNNFFLGNYYTQEAIDNDDGSAYYNTHHNFFVYGSRGMKNDFDGHDNHHHHNVYAYISLGVDINGQLPGHIDMFYNNTVVLRSEGGYARYDCGCALSGDGANCPLLKDNHIMTPAGTMDNICGKSLPDRQQAGLDVGTTVSKWPSDEAVFALAREVIALPSKH